jgi:hypothetical protein
MKTCIRTIAVIVLLALIAPACKKASAPRPAPVDWAAIPGDLRVVQSVVARFGDRQILGRAVLEKRGIRLDFWLLTPTGTRLAHFHQEGADIQADVRFGAFEGLDPAYLLHDLRWVFFPGCQVVGDISAAKCRIGDTRIREHTDPETGILIRRDFKWQGIRETVTFAEHVVTDGISHPRRIRLDNPRFDYSLDILVEDWRVPVEEQ